MSYSVSSQQRALEALQQALDNGKFFINLAKRHPALKHGIPAKLFKAVEAILSHRECHVRLKQETVSGFI